MNEEEIKSLKRYVKTTGHNIFATFKVEIISNLIIYYENLQKQNAELKEENENLRTRIKTIKRLRKIQTQKKNKYKKIVTDLQNALIIKNNKINKAIEYIKDQGCYDEDNKGFCDDLNYYAIPKLLEILMDGDIDE